jgi:iron complex transport system ATP-binding protein
MEFMEHKGAKTIMNLNKRTPNLAESRLVAENITIRRGNRMVISNASLHIKPGEILAILGPNGAGKSTLLKALLGFIPTNEGKISIQGRDLEKIPLGERAGYLAYVPQRSELKANITVSEVVSMGRFVHRGGKLGLNAHDYEAIFSAMTHTDIKNLAQRLFSTLSGGEQARVLIARALATEAPILLLDEPTASLDIPHAMDCLFCLRLLANRGKGILIVMHDLNQAREWTDRALLINHGQVVHCGLSPEVIINSHVAPTYGVELIAGGAYGFRRISAPISEYSSDISCGKSLT